MRSGFVSAFPISAEITESCVLFSGFIKRYTDCQEIGGVEQFRYKLTKKVILL